MATPVGTVSRLHIRLHFVGKRSLVRDGDAGRILNIVGMESRDAPRTEERGVVPLSTPLAVIISGSFELSNEGVAKLVVPVGAPVGDDVVVA